MKKITMGIVLMIFGLFLCAVGCNQPESGNQGFRIVLDSMSKAISVDYYTIQKIDLTVKDAATGTIVGTLSWDLTVPGDDSEKSMVINTVGRYEITVTHTGVNVDSADDIKLFNESAEFTIQYGVWTVVTVIPGGSGWINAFSERLIFRDDFDQRNDTAWTYFNDFSDQIQYQDGILHLSLNVTDQPPVIVYNNPLITNYRIVVHHLDYRANDHFGWSIRMISELPVQIFDQQLIYIYAGQRYDSYRYGGGWIDLDQATEMIMLEDANWSDGQIAWEPGFFQNTWITDTLMCKNGFVSYENNGIKLERQFSIIDPDQFLEIQPSGWWTGHYSLVDYIEIWEIL